MAPRFSHLTDWLAWQESFHPKAIDLGLERVREVAIRLDATLSGRLLRPKAKTVLVAGTNGKGSCIATMAALLRAQGLAIGSYNSPHLLRYNERITINAVEASDQSLCAAFDAIDRARGDISLSYFEFGTLAAFWLMAQADLDVWLIEVGLGGRLDATNLLDADVAIITSIALDHEAYLGDTRELIAVEKLGIARANKLLVCADENPPSTLVAGVARIGCRVLWAGRDFSWRVDDSGAVISLSAQHQLRVPRLQLPLPSVAAALVACDHLGLLTQIDNLPQLLGATRLIGRWQRFTCQGVQVLLDVAHNPASTQALADYIAQDAQPFIIVVGMMADKNIIESLKPLTSALYVHTIGLPLPRAASASALAQYARSLGMKTSEHENLQKALEPVLAQCLTEQARLVICGSFHTLAAAYPALTALGAKEVCDG
ncbi:MAG TPA: folylpolyglutamate synthase/dihydrofolate synthase family protein [Cellvibrionaceae bacterium]